MHLILIIFRIYLPIRVIIFVLNMFWNDTIKLVSEGAPPPLPASSPPAKGRLNSPPVVPQRDPRPSDLNSFRHGTGKILLYFLLFPLCFNKLILHSLFMNNFLLFIL